MSAEVVCNEELKDTPFNILSFEATRGSEQQKQELVLYLLTGTGGAEKDPARAVALLKEYIGMSDSYASLMWILGVCYEYGFGCTKDTHQAESLYNRSGAKGNELAKLLAYGVEERKGNAVFTISECGMITQLLNLYNQHDSDSFFEQIALLSWLTLNK